MSPMEKVPPLIIQAIGYILSQTCAAYRFRSIGGIIQMTPMEKAMQYNLQWR